MFWTTCRNEKVIPGQGPFRRPFSAESLFEVKWSVCETRAERSVFICRQLQEPEDAGVVPAVTKTWDRRPRQWCPGWSMSEKYMSIGAPMTELPLAQPRGHTSHSQRATSAMAGGGKFHDSCYSSSHANGVSRTREGRAASLCWTVTSDPDRSWRPNTISVWN